MKQQLRAAHQDLIGSVLLGRYRVVRELAKGGMGVVYLARAEGAVGFVKPVVIKLLLPEHAQDDRFVRMFVREAQILSQLRHPSLVDVLEFGEEDGAYVLVLEYVRGYHLGQWLRYLSIKKREAPAEVFMQIVIDVLDALHHAHNQVHPDGSPMQIVHRDVSPSNILLDENGRARLLDFGVARMRGGGHDWKTQVDGFMGKLPYTAPEMFAGVDASPKSDLYACGVVLHEALLGQNVFRAEMQAATLQKVMTHVPEPVEGVRPGVPEGLDIVLAKALVKSRDHRHVDALAFAAALRRLQHEQESDIRARLASLLQSDFGSEMADLLNLESLAHRDEAWRRLNQTPSRQSSTRGNASEPPAGMSSVLPPPPAIGATVANSPSARNAARQAQQSVAPPPFDSVPRDLAEFVPQTPPPRSLPAESLPPEPLLVPGAGSQPAPVMPLSMYPQPSAASANNRFMLAGLFVVGGLALGAIALPFYRVPASPARPPAIRVVTQQLPPTPTALPAQPSLPLAPVTGTAPRVAPNPAASAGRGKHEPKDPRLGLTQALRKQQPALEACFVKHSVSLSGRPTTKIDFDLDAQGKLTRVQLSPPALASTPLGECLLRVARSTPFPPQQKAMSFSIPISARSSPAP